MTTQKLKAAADNGTFSHDGVEYQIVDGEVEVPVDVAHHIVASHPGFEYAKAKAAETDAEDDGFVDEDGKPLTGKALKAAKYAKAKAAEDNGEKQQ